jgi:hypothetical protein
MRTMCVCVVVWVCDEVCLPAIKRSIVAPSLLDSLPAARSRPDLGDPSIISADEQNRAAWKSGSLRQAATRPSAGAALPAFPHGRAALPSEPNPTAAPRAA